MYKERRSALHTVSTCSHRVRTVMVTSYRAVACGCVLRFGAKVMGGIKVQYDAQFDAGSLLQIITGN